MGDVFWFFKFFVLYVVVIIFKEVNIGVVYISFMSIDGFENKDSFDEFVNN